MPVPTGDILSASDRGRPIAITATATPGTQVHAAGLTGFEEVYLFATNRSPNTATITVEWGGTADADHIVESWAIPGNTPPYPIAVGQRIRGGLVIAVFSNTASAINITGWVNKVI